MVRADKMLLATVVGAAFLACGCSAKAVSPNSSVASNSVQTTSAPQKTIIVGGDQYRGEANLKKYEDAAQAHPKDAQAQFEAAVAAHINGEDTKAIKYYEKAIALDPKYGIAYNNLGNIYFRYENQPKTALSYYEKATQVDPTYAYGWINLALCQQALGKSQDAQETVKQGLQHVPKTDPQYKDLEKMLGTLK